MPTGYYNTKQIPPREVVVDTLEIIDIRSGHAHEISVGNLTTDELYTLLHELWPDFFPPYKSKRG